MYKQIEEDLRAALDAGSKEEASTLRMLKSSLINERIAKGEELDDADYIRVLQKEAKQRKESIEGYQSAGRKEQAQKEQDELGIINRYLPEKLTDAELDQLVSDAIAEVGATRVNELGQVMKALQPKIAGRAEGGEAAVKIRQRLQH